MKRLVLICAMVLLCAACSPKNQQADLQPLSQKEKAVALLKSIETGDATPVTYINPDKYIQHNLMVKDGLAGFGELMKQLPEGSAKVNVVRAFEDGEYAVTHTEYNFFGPKIGFDIFRFEDGKIVEHWDNLQITAGLNPSKRSMIDGATAITNRANTDNNKALVRSFIQDILRDGKMEKLTAYFNGDNYIQHNPQIGDGLSGLDNALKAMAKANIVMRYDRIHKVLGEGNFVLTVSEGSFAGKPTAFYDLFRVEDAKIAEHWDVLETIPARSDWNNENGKF